ncbi:2-hydroxy-3-keto-5-methylthiopentenyl-1-phosphate phosphatase [Pseudoxanthomonas sp. SORGH_AS 997]|jgi:2-hydroxy-3-keto-5-methylthiopentenyl-1-phosphate phosphatase|uniref:2-hydroxy-3-keto-5-methylthiopentenyl-1-phosphate phosphatase n=1 Tax=Pseudoxanthomonas winnipegensis TaxID=2480810 RepID=A0AAW8GFW5_9GAMM|nr:2-hydroxy-3-keto-5-methylthiopentenyl-1-phosphate phosphatase [Pseudoxanthomonas winnipegensis]MDQ1134533.1 2-hydroxy-3-keto-5-methylthiopentenyl-1-phosphate phosphatase [Pseudoxanthomonas winnipegensis]MDR6139238.1 2-hydroxy-3-keto-5-methylthiopentenyl-1-phosphate phosphatase [Pseudoxanthomonas sp. SORGH_AS_0997]
MSLRSVPLRWTVLCDFDGTIGLRDTIDTLLQRFGRPGWEALEDDWLAGRIGSRACMRGQVALLDMDAAQFEQHLSGLDIDPAFPAFAAAVAARGWPLEIVSDGLDLPIRLLLAREGVAPLPLYANRFHPVGERRWNLESPHQAPSCGAGTCKCARAAQARRHAPGGQVLLVGDGTSDFCVAGRADYVFAKRKLIAHCRDHALAHSAIEGFAEALALLPALESGALTRHAPLVSPAVAIA